MKWRPGHEIQPANTSAGILGPPLLAGIYFLLAYVAKMRISSITLTLATLVLVGRLFVLVLERFPRR